MTLSYFFPQQEGRLPDETYTISQDNLLREIWGITPVKNNIILSIDQKENSMDFQIKIIDKFLIDLESLKNLHNISILGIKFNLITSPIIPQSLVKDIKATFNSEPILLSIKNVENNAYYFIPSVEFLQNQSENVLEVTYVYPAEPGPLSNIKVPIFFRKQYYSKTLSFPIMPIVLSSFYRYGKYYLDYEQKLEDYDILNSLSGFQAWYYKDYPYLGSHKVIYPIKSQKKTSDFEGRFSTELDINETIAPHAFFIYLIPSYKIFLLPLVFLWFPLLYNFFSKSNFLIRIILIYGIILGILGISSIMNLPKIFNLIVNSFKFYHLLFAIIFYIFPIIYTLAYMNLLKIKK